MPARSLLRLTLVRHAKTEPAAPGQEDWDRVLEPRGQRDAPEMARRLKQIAPKPDRILSSPAVRAITTATIMARELGVAAQQGAAGRAAVSRVAEGHARRSSASSAATRST